MKRKLEMNGTVAALPITVDEGAMKADLFSSNHLFYYVKFQWINQNEILRQSSICKRPGNSRPLKGNWKDLPTFVESSTSFAALFHCGNWFFFFFKQAINDLKNTFERKPRISKRVNRNKYNGRFRRMRDEVTLVDRPIVGSRNKRQMLTKEVAEFAWQMRRKMANFLRRKFWAEVNTRQNG